MSRNQWRPPQHWAPPPPLQYQQPFQVVKRPKEKGLATRDRRIIIGAVFLIFGMIAVQLIFHVNLP